ncbi:MAG: response regulator transcription factor [Telluria sp.]|jgi:two-component system invasion response regulator UvrY
MIRVLLTDDHPVVRSGYRRLLEQAGGIAIAEAGSAEQAYAEFVRQAVDVCVTDLSLPGAGGIELLHRIKARDDKARVLVFSMYDSAHLVRRTLEAGACGFVSKQAAPDELVAGVRAAHAGQRFLSSGLPRHLLYSGVDDETRRLESLSGREFEVFRLLAEGRSSADCALLLNISQKTAANIQTRIKSKLNVSTSAALVHLALRCGVIASG